MAIEFINGKPWKNQYLFNAEQSTDITSWTTGTDLAAAVWKGQAFVTSNRVYIAACSVGYSNSKNTYTAPINSDGTLGTWASGPQIPGYLKSSQAIVTKSRVYLLGGVVNSPVSTVYTAEINSDGTITSWSSGTSLPDVLGYSQAVVTNNRVYLLGGIDGSGLTDTVYTAPIDDTTGLIGTWATGTSLPNILYDSSAIVIGDYVYLIGGYNTALTSDVLRAPIASDGTIGTWASDSSIPAALRISQAIATDSRVYLLGGVDASSSTDTVYTAPITSGAIGTWATGTSLPIDLSYTCAIVTSSKIHLLGGLTSGPISTVCEASFDGGLNDYANMTSTGWIYSSIETPAIDVSGLLVNPHQLYGSINIDAPIVSGLVDIDIVGNLSAPIASVSGEIIELIDGAVVSAVPTINATLYQAPSGSIEISLPEVFGDIVNPTVLYGNINTDPYISGSAITTLVLDGNIVIAQPGVSGYTGEVGAITARLPVIVADAVTPYMITGRLVDKKSVISAYFTTDLIVSGDINTKCFNINATIQQDQISTVRLVAKTPTVNGFLLEENQVDAQIVSKPPDVNGSFEIPFDYDIIKYNRYRQCSL